MSIETVLRFAQLGLAAPVLKVIDEVGYEIPTPIQAQSIPPLLEGRDLLGQAQTGTGKTAAFAMPILSRVDLARKRPQALILTPTRELAIQVAEAIQTYAKHLPGLHVLPIYGGQHIGLQLRSLQRGVHVLVGTPGRMLDHLERNTIRLDALSTVVLDEADEMLRMGFLQDVERILEHTPEEKQVALFSATMPNAILGVAQRQLREPVEIRIKAKTATVSTVHQSYFTVSGMHNKLEALTRVLETADFDAMLVFTRTRNATNELAEKLEARGFACAALNGDMSQASRERTIQRLKRGMLDILVATDVAARGLDVDRVSHVVNYDIPYDTEAYVHRVGRTARAGREGEAILFVQPREKRMLRAIERATGQPIEPMKIPSHKAIADHRVSRFKQLITDTIEGEDLSFFERMITEYEQEREIDPARIAAALAYLAQKDRPLQLNDADPSRHEIGHHRPSLNGHSYNGHSNGERRTEGNGQRRIERNGERRAERNGQPRKPTDFVRPTSPVRHTPVQPGMERYRIDVGLEHGAQPKHIVGAIANEAGLRGHDIANIRLHDTHSILDLPEGMPKQICRLLKRVYVCGRPLRINLLRDYAKPGKSPISKKTKSSRPVKSGKNGRKPAGSDRFGNKKGSGFRKVSKRRATSHAFSR